MKTELYLNIDDLIIEGLNDLEQEQLQETVAQTLNQLIEMGGLPNHLKQSTVLWDNKTITATPRTNMQELGASVAETIYRGR